MMRSHIGFLTGGLMLLGLSNAIGQTATPTATPSLTPSPSPTRTLPPVFCPATPPAECERPTSAGGFLLIKNDNSNDNRDRIVWRWGRAAAAVDKIDFGNPDESGGTTYNFCIYDNDGANPPYMIFTRPFLAGEFCFPGRPCWRESASGFRFRAGPQAGGPIKLRLKAGAANAARLKFVSRGPSSSPPAFPILQSPAVTALVVNSEGSCWAADFSSPPLPVGDSSVLFKDRSD